MSSRSEVCRWQFSLRSLFAATAVAALLALLARFALRLKSGELIGYIFVIGAVYGAAMTLVGWIMERRERKKLAPAPWHEWLGVALQISLVMGTGLALLMAAMLLVTFGWPR